MTRRSDARWWLLSLAAHVVGLVLLGVVLRHPGLLPWEFGAEAGRADTVMIAWPQEAPQQVVGTAERQDEQVAIGPMDPAQISGGVPGLRDTAFGGLDVGDLGGEAVPPVSATPGFGDGRLWVRPGAVIARGGLPTGAPIGGVSAPLDVAAHEASIDSVLRQRILAFLDTLPPDSFAVNMRPPSWTTEVDGRTWGIDQQWIYLGDFRLPTALLGLLPIPGQGNYELGRRNADLQRIREDIMRAASRAADAADFRRYVNELRERRDAERRQRENE